MKTKNALEWSFFSAILIIVIAIITWSIMENIDNHLGISFKNVGVEVVIHKIMYAVWGAIMSILVSILRPFL